MATTILVTTGATATFIDLIKFAVSDTFLDYVARKGFSRLIIQYGNDQSIIEQRVGHDNSLVPLSDNNSNNSDKDKYREPLNPTRDERTTTTLANAQNKDHSCNKNQQQSGTTPSEQNYDAHSKKNSNNNKQKTSLRVFKHSRSSLIIESYAFNSNLLEDLANAQVVVSHSGTGSILDALRLKKPLLVVVNEKLMDNHQIEIASMLQEMQLLVYFQFQTQNKQLEEHISVDSREHVNNYRLLLDKLDQLIEGTTKLRILPPPNSNALNDVINQELGYV